MAEEPQSPEAGAESAGPQFGIQKIYTKDTSFETPNSPDIFREQGKFEINLNLGTDNKPMGDDLFEVALSLTVTAKMGEKTAYLAEVKQAGIFGIRGLNDEQLKQALAVHCPTILFPYAREAVSDLVARGGFPQLLLAPVNFEAIYMQHLQQQQQQQAGAGEA